MTTKSLRRDPPEGSVRKVNALRILANGKMSVSDFAAGLQEAGFHVPGTRKAWNILNKLLVYGLVRRIEDEKNVNYEIPSGSGTTKVERKQRLILWEITKKGEERLRYYDKRG